MNRAARPGVTLPDSCWPYTDSARDGLPREAELSLHAAARHCHDCRWYHGTWTTWRALELVSGADVHRDFYRNALPPLPQRPRVLISGTGDNALLAVVADALGTGAPDAQIHALDRCRTPLLACQRFAETHALDVQCHVHDIVDFQPPPHFDLIVVHAFLGFIPPARRPALLSRWFDLLAPGGRLMMVQRLRPDRAGDPANFSKAQTDRFVRDVIQAFRARPARAPLDAIRLEQAAREYARNKITHPVTGMPALHGLFNAAGLRIQRCQTTATQRAGAGDAAAGPSLRNSDSYAQLIAVRES